MGKNKEEKIQPEVAEAAEKTKAAGLEGVKLDVSVRPIQPKNNLYAFATVTINDSFAVENICVRKGEKGLYVNMPSVPDGHGNYNDVFKPITADARNLIVSRVLEAYAAAIEKMREMVDASRSATEKPSLTDTLKDNAEKVKKQPKKTAGKSEQSL